MIVERMSELILLDLLNDYLSDISADDYRDFCRKYDIKKIENRSKELTDEFLSKYTIN